MNRKVTLAGLVIGSGEKQIVHPGIAFCIEPGLGDKIYDQDFDETCVNFVPATTLAMYGLEIFPVLITSSDEVTTGMLYEGDPSNKVVIPLDPQNTQSCEAARCAIGFMTGEFPDALDLNLLEFPQNQATFFGTL